MSSRLRIGTLTRSKEPVLPHGARIYAYHHLQTNQVLYSLSRSLDNTSALKQLTFSGKKSLPRALRKDHWKPFFTVKFGIPYQGLKAFKKLREWRKLHEYSWDRDDAEEFISKRREIARREKDEENKDDERKSDKRKKREREHALLVNRSKFIQDQKANSVADLAHTLVEQEQKAAQWADQFSDFGNDAEDRYTSLLNDRGLVDTRIQLLNDEIAKLTEKAKTTKDEGGSRWALQRASKVRSLNEKIHQRRVEIYKINHLQENVERMFKDHIAKRALIKVDTLFDEEVEFARDVYARTVGTEKSKISDHMKQVRDALATFDGKRKTELRQAETKSGLLRPDEFGPRQEEALVRDAARWSAMDAQARTLISQTNALNTLRPPSTVPQRKDAKAIIQSRQKRRGEFRAAIESLGKEIENAENLLGETMSEIQASPKVPPQGEKQKRPEQQKHQLLNKIASLRQKWRDLIQNQEASMLEQEKKEGWLVVEPRFGGLFDGKECATKLVEHLGAAFEDEKSIRSQTLSGNPESPVSAFGTAEGSSAENANLESSKVEVPSNSMETERLTNELVAKAAYNLRSLTEAIDIIASAKRDFSQTILPAGHAQSVRSAQAVQEAEETSQQAKHARPVDVGRSIEETPINPLESYLSHLASVEQQLRGMSETVPRHDPPTFVYARDATLGSDQKPPPAETLIEELARRRAWSRVQAEGPMIEMTEAPIDIDSSNESAPPPPPPLRITDENRPRPTAEDAVSSNESREAPSEQSPGESLLTPAADGVETTVPTAAAEDAMSSNETREAPSKQSPDEPLPIPAAAEVETAVPAIAPEERITLEVPVKKLGTITVHTTRRDMIRVILPELREYLRNKPDTDEMRLDNVAVEWANPLDAEYGKLWPAQVRHEPMGFVRHTARAETAPRRLRAESKFRYNEERLLLEYARETKTGTEMARTKIGQALAKLQRGTGSEGRGGAREIEVGKLLK